MNQGIKDLLEQRNGHTNTKNVYKYKHTCTGVIYDDNESLAFVSLHKMNFLNRKKST